MTHPSQETVPALIEEADPFRVALMLRSLRGRLQALDHEPEQVVSSFPGEALGVQTGEALAWSEETQLSQSRVPEADAIALARALLMCAWDTPALRAVACDAVLAPDDDRLGGGVTVKVGLLATVLMLVASTGFDIRVHDALIHKEPLSPEALAGLALLVRALRGGAKDARGGSAIESDRAAKGDDGQDRGP